MKKRTIEVDKNRWAVNQTRPILLFTISRNGYQPQNIFWATGEYQAVMSGIWMKGSVKLLEMLKRYRRTIV